jgi:hypothetical protein
MNSMEFESQAGLALSGYHPNRVQANSRQYMVALNFGSVTFSAACEAESHFTTRSCFFWPLFILVNLRFGQSLR